MSVIVCVTFVVLTDCESCTRPLSTNPVSINAGEYGLTRETCFVARRLEVVAFAELLRLSWCVLGGVDFFAFFFYFFVSSNTSLLVPGCVQGPIKMRPFFAFRQKSIFIPGCVQGSNI